MKNLVPMLALVLAAMALSVSLKPKNDIVAQNLILKDRNGVVRAELTADEGITLYSEDGKRMLLIYTPTVRAGGGAQIILRGPDERERVRLTTWGGNYLSIMDESWGQRIKIGDYWDSKYNKKIGIHFENKGNEQLDLSIK